MEANSSTKLQDIECIHGEQEGKACRDGNEQGRCRHFCVNSLATPARLRTYLAKQRIAELQKTFAYIISHEKYNVLQSDYLDAVKHDLTELDRIFGEI